MSYEEKRVLVKVYGSLPATSPFLVPVPTAPGKPQQKLHVLAATGFGALASAALHDLGLVLLVASGWRPHRWASFDQYRSVLVSKYKEALVGKLHRPVNDEEVFAYGRKFLAFDSPHETGLAVDFGCGGLSPVSATITQQKQTPFFNWLVGNADRFGWTPYKQEPWHWEHCVSLAAYRTGHPQPDIPNIPPAACDGEMCVEATDDE